VGGFSAHPRNKQADLPVSLGVRVDAINNLASRQPRPTMRHLSAFSLLPQTSHLPKDGMLACSDDDSQRQLVGPTQ
jgi:hypothetical protein